MPADMNVTAVRRPLLPKHPGAWFAKRARVYLAILGCVVAGFFFVAGWMATPAESSGLRGIGVWQTVVAAAALVFAWFRARWGGRQKGREGGAGARYR